MPLCLVIDFTGKHWAYIVYERGTNAAFVTGQAVGAVPCDTLNR